MKKKNLHNSKQSDLILITYILQCLLFIITEKKLQSYYVMALSLSVWFLTNNISSNGQILLNFEHNNPWQ